MDSNQPSPLPPQPPATPPPAPELSKQPEKLRSAPNGHSWGALIGIIIILIVLVVGALYFWGAKLSEDEQNSFIPEETPTEEIAK